MKNLPSNLTFEDKSKLQTPLQKFESSENRGNYLVDESSPIDMVYHYEVNKLFDRSEKEKDFDFEHLYSFPKHYMH
jgi:hypothetical protein